MAANSSTQRATLKDLPTDFSLAFLKGVTLSLKSRQNGFKFADESYYHDVKMFINDEKTIFCSARCFASYKTHDEPRHVFLDIKPTEISLAHCSCEAGEGETCSHIIGLITALNTWQLMGLTEIPAELPCTSLPQRWSVPRGTKIDPEPVPHMTFVNPKPVRKKRPIRNILTDNSGKTLLLFQAAVSYASQGHNVTFISRRALNRMPMSVHGMPRPDTTGSLQTLTFLYLSSAEELIKYCSSIHLKSLMPEVLIVDGLEHYLSQLMDPSPEVGAARLCALFVDCVDYIKRKSDQKKCILLLGCQSTRKMTISSVFRQFNIRMANIAVVSLQDHTYELSLQTPTVDTKLTYTIENSGLLMENVAYGIWKEVKRTNKDTSACTDTSTYTEESELKANVLCLCDVAKYSGEWPQLAEIKEIKGNRALIQWYKGSKTTSWNPCTKRVKTGAKWEPWVEDIKISDIWCSGFELTGAKKLPQKIKEKVDNYHTTLKQDKIKTELE